MIDCDRIVHQRPTAARRDVRHWLEAAVLLAVLVLAPGCADRDRVTITLDAHGPRGPEWDYLQVRAQITGPQDGLTYKWLADTGECVPQETDWPGTTYQFFEEVLSDRVAVEAWRGNRRVAMAEIDVTRRDRRKQPTRRPAIQVAITQVPPYDPRGGTHTRADIAGRITGEFGSDHKLVLYARSNDAWYIQPEPDSQHAVLSDNTWSSWTHLGSSYAALVVRKSHAALPMLDVLPRTGGEVLARAVVEGIPVDPRAAPAGSRIIVEAARQSPPVSISEPVALRIAAGRGETLIDASGNTWQPDQGFVGGVPVGRNVALDVTNTDTPELYRAERYNVTRFHCGLPNGRYRVKLHFAEMFPAVVDAGQRVFSFTVEGREFRDFDIFAKAGGRQRAHVETILTEVSDGELTIRFIPNIQSTVINGIEIIPDSYPAPKG